MQTTRCPNFNHRRTDPPVRGCPMCGAVVNPAIRSKKCAEADHATRRKNGDLFCTACGTQLRVP